MKNIVSKLLALAIMISIVSCDDDDKDNMAATDDMTTMDDMATTDDMTTDDMTTDDSMVVTDFTGTFIQEDQMGRPGINTVFTATEVLENSFNKTIPADMVVDFQADFQSRIEAYYSAYSATAGATIEYENNILGLDLPTLTTALALDVLQVSPEASNTTYFESTSNFLTGRKLEDDVIDVSLILVFGGTNGDRFSDSPNLVSDNVGLESGTTSNSFPYLTASKF